MKILHQFLILAVLALLQVALAAHSQESVAEPQKSVIVSWPDNTPDSVYNDAKKAITDAGGWITHEFQFIKAFTAEASSAALKSVQAASANFLPVIEDDAPVTVYGGEQ